MGLSPYYDDGTATIYQGDCRAVLPALDFGTADVMITDPPYGDGFSSGMVGHHSGETVANDSGTAVRDEALELWGDRAALVFGKWSIPHPTRARMVLTWEKGNHVGMGDLSLPWKPNTEEVYVLGTGFTGHRGTSVLRCNAVAGCVGTRNTGDRHHVTEKPVDLMRALVGKCDPMATVVDPFMGSGTTLRAAKDMGRRSVGIELEERYCETAAKRLAQEVLAL